ncbi:MAG: ABC transporter ATP-binding protein [Haloarculaceae archaeon]
MGPPTLAATGLRRIYGPVTALDGVDLTLSTPEVLGIAGPNGSGKTTLIRTLLGLERPSAGEATVEGTPSVDLDAATRARIGYMPQATAVYDDLTVRENVGFFAALYGVGDRQAAVDAALSFVDLDERADDRIGALSGGMVRRASLACAVVHDPAVLALDEPTVGLDPELRRAMWAGFRERRAAGSLVLVSTHYLDEARRCDRVLLLREGRVLACDTPEALRERTGARDMEAAFLVLLDADGGAATVDDGDLGANLSRDGADGAPGPPDHPTGRGDESRREDVGGSE